MKAEFKNYLELIGLTGVIINRVEEIYQFYENSLKILGEDILDIFVTDYVSKEGLREYENLWFFSKNYIMEAKLFLQQDDFDLAPIAKKIKYIQVKKNDYDFIKLNDKSRLYILYSTSTLSKGQFKASKENCRYLRDIYLKHILPNITI